MKNDVIATPVAHPGGRIRLSGRVAGIEACELIADCDELVIGSGLDCDLTVADPLFPRRAFRLTRRKCHCGTEEACRCFWNLEAFPAGRIYINNRLAQKEKMKFGDTIASGCHQFAFTRAEAAPRNRRANINVGDLCQKLLAAPAIPPGFLSQRPLHRYLVRRRQSLILTAILTLIIIAALYLTPRRSFYADIQEPIEVEMVAERLAAPAPDAVRSLEKVVRRTAPETDAARATAELKPLAVPELKPIPSSAALRAESAPAPAPPALKAGALAEAVAAPLAIPEQSAVAIQRPVGSLALAGAPRRRLTIAEAERNGVSHGLRPATAAVPNLPSGIAAPVPSSRRLTQDVKGAAAPSLQAERAKNLQALAAFTPSPVQFEAYRGEMIPVARIAEQLTEMQTAAGAGEYKLDGTVSDAEIAMSWKSGQFRVHGPGHPPPPGRPPAYCYVSKMVDAGGKPCLYISFVCHDPNLDALVTKYRGGRGDGINNDDSVEIYLDTNNDRKDYYQLLINSRGTLVGHYHPSPDIHNPWNVKATIKTSINKPAGQWTCEVMVPFDQIGGVPAKGARWTVNFVRNYRGQPWNRRPDAQVQTWFEVYEKNAQLHRPSLFGVFQW